MSESKKRKSKSSQKVVKDPKVVEPNAKLRKKPVYKSFRLHKPIKTQSHRSRHGGNSARWL